MKNVQKFVSILAITFAISIVPLLAVLVGLIVALFMAPSFFGIILFSAAIFAATKSIAVSVVGIAFVIALFYFRKFNFNFVVTKSAEEARCKQYDEAIQ